MRFRNLSWLILALFFCSGATALVYEVVWSKFLSQMIGSTVYAQTVVLAVFMGGLAMGNRLFGRLADRLKEPVKAYGFLEAAIGLYAIAFPFLDRAADSVFIKIGSTISEKAGLLLVLKGVLSALLLLTPTILMGGTLPLMASWLQRSAGEAGRKSALFYAVNSLGAVLGSGLAGFYLIYHFGMKSTLNITATANLIIGAVAVWASHSSYAKPEDDRSSVSEADSDATSSGTFAKASLIVAITGGVSMGLEVLASRSLAMIFGSSLQSFAIVLMAFILGIGLGSVWIASGKKRLLSTESMVALLLCAAGGWVALLVFNIEQWVEFYRFARTGLNRNEVGYTYNLLLNSGISLAILGLPAALIGAVLPLMIRVVSREGAPLGSRVGSLLTWNTLGAVTGVLLTGFIIMPSVGLRNAFAVLALLLSFVGLLMALWNRLHLVAIPATLACLLSCSIFVFGKQGWQHVISSGVFRLMEAKYDPHMMEQRKRNMEILFYEDAPDATVGVEQAIDGHRVLTINGKPDASTYVQDLPTQYLLAHLPLLAKPESKDVFLLGWGSGVTAGAILGYPVENVVLAENCDPVIRAARFFETWHRNALEDPRVHLWREDGRTVLKLFPQKYDVVITAPSNPWSAGVGSVFSKDFYELAASRLKPGGLVVQWFQLYEMQDDIVQMLLRTFNSVFPYMEVWDPTGGDIIMIGSMQPWKTGPDQFRKGFQMERVRTDLWNLDLQTPEAVMARQLASQRTASAIAGPGPIQTDLSPRLEYTAPRALFLQQFCKLVERYDERTHQQLLAPPEKQTILHSLSKEEVQLVFKSFATVNAELFHTIFGGPRGENIPCVFQVSKQVPPPAATGTIYDAASRAFATGQILFAQQLMEQALAANTNDQHAVYLHRVFENAAKAPFVQ